MKAKKSRLFFKFLLIILIVFPFSSCNLLTPKCNVHDYGNWETVISPTCISEGLEHRVCSKCGKERKRVMKMTAHAYGEQEVITPATCTTTGKAVYTCQTCNQKKESVLVRLPHTYEKNEDGTDKYYISPHVCNEKAKVWRVCTVCNTKEYESSTFYYKHDWDDELTIDVPATCTTDGKKSRHCKYCDQTIDEEIIPASHDYVLTSKIRPSCTTDGVADYVCSVCGDKKTEVLEKKGHKFISYTIVKGATCTSEGIKSSRCVNCDEVFELPIPIDPNAHSYGEEVIIDPGDCKEKTNGTSYRTCKYCNNVCYSVYLYQHDFAHSLLCSKCGKEKVEGKFKYSRVSYYDCIITQYLSTDITNLRIPREIDGLSVVGLGKNAFSNHTELEYIWLHNSIYEIGNYGFEGCTSLKELYIPQTTINIGKSILKDCPSLERVVLPILGNYYPLNYESYSESNNTTLGSYFNDTENTGLTEVSQWSYKNKQYTNYNIPSSLKEVYVHGYTISTDALENCDMVKELYVGGMRFNPYGPNMADSFLQELNMKGWSGRINLSTYYQRVIPQSIFY